MKVGQCPSCGAPVDFPLGTGKVKVCEHCHTVVLRGQARLEDHGRVAQLADTDSPLKVGLQGRYAQVSFTVAGRLQKDWGQGAWDEWFLSFEDGRTGWLSESEGAWHLMFPIAGAAPRGWEDLAPTQLFRLKDRQFVVEERGRAQCVSAEGELPDYAPQSHYVDATGAQGVFASIDYGPSVVAEDGELYAGNRVSLAQLGFDQSELNPTPKKEALTHARCTQCNGNLDFKAPDRARRVVCPYCGALLDVSHGTLSFLQLLEKPAEEPLIPLGSKGTFEKTEWVCIAFLVRSCNVEGSRYGWHEYLLFNRVEGFTWLMNANGHWTWLTPLPAGEVWLSGKACVYGGDTFKAFQTVKATTEAVVGECYWAVEQGEEAWASEFVAPPRSINIDRATDTLRAHDEATFTLGRMVSAEEVAAGFQLKSLPRSHGIAPAQENPHRAGAKEAWKWTALWAVGLLLVSFLFSRARPSTPDGMPYLTLNVPVNTQAAPGSPEAMSFSPPFEIPHKTRLEFKVDAPRIDNTWLAVQADLVNEATDEVVSVASEVSFYAGTTDGERWSEGSRDDTRTTSEVEPGTYVLRTINSYDMNAPIDGYVLTVGPAGAAGGVGGLICFLVLLIAGPLFKSMRAAAFETERWNDSLFQSGGGGHVYTTFPHAKDDE